MASSATEVSSFSTGIPAMDKRVGGGIPYGSLTLIEGQSSSGKSVVSQQLTYGALQSEGSVAYYTAQTTVPGLVSQMQSINLDVTDDFLLDRLRIYPFQVSGAETNVEGVFSRLSSHIGNLPSRFKFVVLDPVTSIISNSSEKATIGFFAMCKELCGDGRTISIVADSYAFDESMLLRLRWLCDAHLSLHLEELGERMVSMLEVSKIRNAERNTDNQIGFEVLAGTGIKLIPFTKAKA